MIKNETPLADILGAGIVTVGELLQKIQEQDTPEILDTLGASKILGYHPVYLAILVKEGKIQAEMVGKRLLFRRSEVLSFLEKRESGRK